MYVRVKNLLMFSVPGHPGLHREILLTTTTTKETKRICSNMEEIIARKLIKIFASHVTNRKCVRHSKM